jgi:hypothetical protein
MLVKGTTPQGDGEYSPTGDWRDQRYVMGVAYKKTGQEVPTNIPTEQWKFTEAVLKAYRDIHMRWCATCKYPIFETRDEIRCLDCRLVFCPRCAEKHFWPQGRKPGD